jgi:hypothetical protein
MEQLTEKEKHILRILCQNEIVTLEADDDSQEKTESINEFNTIIEKLK